MGDLINRLKCRYSNGPIIDGEPEFGWRDFGGPAPAGMVLPSPIMIEAADRIEELEQALNDAIDIACDVDSHGQRESHSKWDKVIKSI
jgi:hypothetical protein